MKSITTQKGAKSEQENISADFYGIRLTYRQTKTIIKFSGSESEVICMPRMGRPPLQDPKESRITVRFTSELFAKLEEYCKEQNLGRAEAVRIAVERMLSEKKN